MTSVFSNEDPQNVAQDVSEVLGEWQTYLFLWPLQKQWFPRSVLSSYQRGALEYWDDYLDRIDRK